MAKLQNSMSLENNKQRISVKALFEKEGKILLVKDPKDVWELPGGRIEFNESPDQALTRELNEELGFEEIKIGDPIHIWSFSSTHQDIETQYVIIVYECFTQTSVIRKNDEYKEYRWVPISEAFNLNMRGGYKDAIKKYKEHK